MIDTITIMLKRSDAQKYWHIDNVTKKLEASTVSITTRGGIQYVSGKIKNMKIRISNDLLTINGSLAKYYFDNNLQTLDADEIVIAIVWLSKDLGMPIERGYIKRIDVGRNIIVSKNVRKYLDCFDDTSGYHKDRTNDRLLYKKTNGTYSLTLYDKVKELKSNDRELYQYNRNGYLKDKKILRFEVKLEQRINHLLKYKSVRVVHLRSKAFLEKLNDFWYDKYKTLSTKKIFTFTTGIHSYTDFKNECFGKAINDMGVTKVYAMLEDLRKAGKITSNQKAYAKQDISKRICGASSLTELDHTVELMTQMDFLSDDFDSDEFLHLENLIVKKRSEYQPKASPYGDVNSELSLIKLRDDSLINKKYDVNYLKDVEDLE